MLNFKNFKSMLHDYNYKRTGRLVDGYDVAFPDDEGEHYLCEPELRYGRRTVSRYVNILMDKWFKKIFGAERNREALVGILRELLPERSIVSIQYGRKPMRKNSPFRDCHDAYFDVECTDSSGARFIVEMQVAEQRHFHERALFYATFPIQEQVLSRSRKRPAGLVGEIFERIFEACEVAKLTDEEFNQYNEESMTQWDYDDIVNTAWLKGEAAGRANGLAEGREEGRAEGRAEGREEGRAEGREKTLEAVRARLRALGMDPEVIEEVAGGVESRR